MEHFKFFQNRECEYFPCHRTRDEEHFNCLFCYCPLYFAGDACGGNFTLTKTGAKDCSACLIPHSAGGYEYILKKLEPFFRKNSADPRENG